MRHASLTVHLTTALCVYVTMIGIMSFILINDIILINYIIITVFTKGTSSPTDQNPNHQLVGDCLSLGSPLLPTLPTSRYRWTVCSIVQLFHRDQWIPSTRVWVTLHCGKTEPREVFNNSLNHFLVMQLHKLIISHLIYLLVIRVGRSPSPEAM